MSNNLNPVLIISPADNVAVALRDLKKGGHITYGKQEIPLVEDIQVKHKIALQAFKTDDVIKMYGVPVGVVTQNIPLGARISIENTKHLAAFYAYRDYAYPYEPPQVAHLKEKDFMGYHRSDGQVGTANYWVFVPLVFCQNRNMKVLKDAFEAELGFKKENDYRHQLRELVSGENLTVAEEQYTSPVFQNIDGVKFLTHEGGCGGTREDAQALVNLLAGYIKNPNVAGATVLSLGCQHAQMSLLQQALEGAFKTDKPVHYFEQQQYKDEKTMLSEVIQVSYKAIEAANMLKREPTPLRKLTLGMECGGSDGFSGISANPLIGLVSDKIAALKGKTMLSEFPELCGVEQDLIDRSVNKRVGERFIQLMEVYNAKAKQAGSGFEMNPSPGNIKDGLITDAIKSAGAATKGGRSPVCDVLDYAEYVKEEGLTLLCTPGNDVESTTGLAGAGATIILFSTGLGTPTGNPICPVIKIASNSMLPERMKDIIDFDAGRLFSEGKSLDELSEELIDLIIAVASGEVKTKAMQLGQDDFIPWKRGVSL